MTLPQAIPSTRAATARSRGLALLEDDEPKDLEEAREHAREAWAEDAKGRGSLSRKRWLDSIFELADTCARHEDPASPCGERSLRWQALLAHDRVRASPPPTAQGR